jgi:hypothetical protein
MLAVYELRRARTVSQELRELFNAIALDVRFGVVSGNERDEIVGEYFRVHVRAGIVST